MRGWLAPGWIAILLATLAVGAFASGKTSLQEVSEGLSCQCGCGLTIANCNHPQCEFSVPARQQIESMISQGMGREQIIGFFRAKYGEKILSAPTTEGFNLLAWGMPSSQSSLAVLSSSAPSPAGARTRLRRIALWKAASCRTIPNLSAASNRKFGSSADGGYLGSRDPAGCRGGAFRRRSSQ
jgi:cytochrome c-type biogenesis protein CcmH/NrfF